jgi:hypothetical protein
MLIGILANVCVKKSGHHVAANRIMPSEWRSSCSCACARTQHTHAHTTHTHTPTHPPARTHARTHTLTWKLGYTTAAEISRWRLSTSNVLHSHSGRSDGTRLSWRRGLCAPSNVYLESSLCSPQITTCTLSVGHGVYAVGGQLPLSVAIASCHCQFHCQLPLPVAIVSSIVSCHWQLALGNRSATLYSCDFAHVAGRVVGLKHTLLGGLLALSTRCWACCWP